MKNDERKGLQLEIKARKEVTKRLAYPIDQLVKADTKERSKREERAASLSEYKTVAEAQDAYGYDLITDDEYHAICEAIESGEKYVEETMTPVNLALKILRDFTRRMESEIRSIEFELLPEEEKKKRLAESEARRAEMEARKEARRR
jgi:hypothetical protein